MSVGPVAWVHGYTMNSRIWRELWSLLPGRDHVGIDLPLHGVNATQPPPASLSGWAAGVAHEMERNGARDLVGLSFGSSIALQVAVEHPELVDRLVLAAPTLSGVPDDRQARAKYLLLMMQRGQLGPGPALARLWMNDPPPIFAGLRRFPSRYAALTAEIETHQFGELRSGAMSALSRTVQDAALLSDVRAEVLLVVGTEDMPQFRENAELIAAHVRQCETLTLPGAGHLPILEEPERCAGALADFLGRVPAHA